MKDPKSNSLGYLTLDRAISKEMRVALNSSAMVRDSRWLAYKGMSPNHPLSYRLSI